VWLRTEQGGAIFVFRESQELLPTSSVRLHRSERKDVRSDEFKSQLILKDIEQANWEALPDGNHEETGAQAQAADAGS
jgi:hypothetical protein